MPGLGADGLRQGPGGDVNSGRDAVGEHGEAEDGGCGGEYAGGS